jgi:hypothetical protein
MALSGDGLFKKFHCTLRGNISNKKNKMEWSGIAMVSTRRNQNEMYGPARESEVTVSKSSTIRKIIIEYLDGPEDPMSRNYLLIRFDSIESTSNTSEVAYIIKLLSEVEVKFIFGTLNAKLGFME